MAIRPPASSRRAVLGSRLLIVAAVLGLAPALAACDSQETAVAVPETCASIVERAARASEIRQQVDLLDDAIVACRAIEALDVELRRHPGIIGFDTITFVEQRCDRSPDQAVVTSAICTRAAPPTTTTTLVVLTYQGQTLDGRTVEITEEDVAFVEGKPEPIVRLVDIALEDGCDALATERANWEARVDDPVIGQQASVYARHADNVAVFVGCTPPPTTGD
jgi:hypothetical protein